MGTIVSKEEFDKLEKYIEINQLTFEEWHKAYQYFIESIKTNVEFYDLRNGEMILHHEPIISTQEELKQYNHESTILQNIIINIWKRKKR